MWKSGKKSRFAEWSVCASPCPFKQKEEVLLRTFSRSKYFIEKWISWNPQSSPNFAWKHVKIEVKERKLIVKIKFEEHSPLPPPLPNRKYWYFFCYFIIKKCFKISNFYIYVHIVLWVSIVYNYISLEMFFFFNSEFIFEHLTTRV